MHEPIKIFKFKILTITSKSHHNKNESMKKLIQAGNYVTQSINRLEAQMNRLIKDRDEETLPNTFLTIRDCSSHIDKNEESWCLEDFDQDSISSHQFEVDQSQPLDQLASLTSMRLNLIANVNLILNFMI